MMRKTGLVGARLVRLAIVAMLLGQCLVARAADDADRVSALEKKLDQTLDLVRALSQRVQELETQLANGKQPEGANGQVAATQPPAAKPPAAQPAGATG